jgi:hypothetical protein
MTTPSSGRMSSKRLGGQEEAGITKREVSDRSWEFIESGREIKRIGSNRRTATWKPISMPNIIVTSGLLFQSAAGRTGTLTKNRMNRVDAMAAHKSPRTTSL